MKLIEIAGKKFRLATRSARTFALFLDLITTCIGSTCLSFLIGLLFTLVSGDSVLLNTPMFSSLNFMLWILGFLLMDGFKDGMGFGKRALSLQVIRLKDGQPCTFKDSIVRRITGIFQPFDILFSFGSRRQRMGDRIAETVVVMYDTYHEEVISDKQEPEVDTEAVLDNVIQEMTSRLSEAKQKVDASIGIEKKFQNAYEGAVVQAERCEERATIAIQAGREDLAREDIAKRNEYRQHAKQYKQQWEEQKQVVADLKSLLETLQMKTQEAERKRDIIIAQNRNVDAQQHIQQTLSDVQDNAVFEILNKMEQNVSEAVSLAKAASEVDVGLKNTELSREFVGYAEEASIEDDLAELKAKLQ